MLKDEDNWNRSSVVTKMRRDNRITNTVLINVQKCMDGEISYKKYYNYVVTKYGVTITITFDIFILYSKPCEGRK